MLAVREAYRGQGIATRLVRMAIDAMNEGEADEVSILVQKPPNDGPQLTTMLGCARD
jgi:N-alpha-acetyltransferase 30